MISKYENLGVTNRQTIVLWYYIIMTSRVKPKRTIANRIHSIAGRLLPDRYRFRVARAYHGFRGSPCVDRPAYDTHSFGNDAEMSSISQMFAKLKGVPGFFNIDDCAHFSLILRTQTALRITGDILEIGSYFGRSTALLAAGLADGEKLVICDAFEADTPDVYIERPSPEQLLSTIRRINPDIENERLEIHVCLSHQLRLDPAKRFRFVHIDGDHSEDGALKDIQMVHQHLLPGGVIAIDDYKHPRWPGVTQAANRFLHETPDVSILADLNRHGESGQKLYLCKKH